MGKLPLFLKVNHHSHREKRKNLPLLKKKSKGPDLSWLSWKKKWLTCWFPPIETKLCFCLEHPILKRITRTPGTLPPDPKSKSRHWRHRSRSKSCHHPGNYNFLGNQDEFKTEHHEKTPRNLWKLKLSNNVRSKISRCHDSMVMLR